MEPSRVGKMMFLWLNSGSIKEVRFINTGMAKINARQEEVRRQAAETSAEGAAEVIYLTQE